MDIQKDGIKYFIFLITQGNTLPYFPQELREIIWDYAKDIIYMDCFLNKTVRLRLKIQTKSLGENLLA